MDFNELLVIAGRTAVVYVLMLVVIRGLGKRTVGNFSAFDLLVALMLGELVDEIIFGDVQFLQGTTAIVAIGALAYADAWLAWWSDRMEAILEGVPTPVVRDGEFLPKGMRRERMNEKDILGQLRVQGITDMREVHLAVVENDGALSVLKHVWAEPAQKADVLADEGRARDRMLEGRDVPPPNKRTDSPAALSQE
jgi:uncharacterized membrane protein YcaP (DUF421 family)